MLHKAWMFVVAMVAVMAMQGACLAAASIDYGATAGSFATITMGGGQFKGTGGAGSQATKGGTTGSGNIGGVVGGVTGGVGGRTTGAINYARDLGLTGVSNTGSINYLAGSQISTAPTSTTYFQPSNSNIYTPITSIASGTTVSTGQKFSISNVNVTTLDSFTVGTNGNIPDGTRVKSTDNPTNNGVTYTVKDNKLTTTAQDSPSSSETAAPKAGKEEMNPPAVTSPNANVKVAIGTTVSIHNTDCIALTAFTYGKDGSIPAGTQFTTVLDGGGALYMNSNGNLQVDPVTVSTQPASPTPPVVPTPAPAPAPARATVAATLLGMSSSDWAAYAAANPLTAARFQGYMTMTGEELYSFSNIQDAKAYAEFGCSLGYGGTGPTKADEPPNFSGYELDANGMTKPDAAHPNGLYLRGYIAPQNMDAYLQWHTAKYTTCTAYPKMNTPPGD